jgi:uncharacterized protein (TIGR03437 family)
MKNVLMSVRLLVFGICTAPLFGQVITTVAGGGWRPFPTAQISAIKAPLGTPIGVALDGQGNLYVADSYNNIVVRISPSGTLSLVAGNGSAGFSGDGGPPTSAALNFPASVAVDSAGDVYIADFNNSRIRKVSGGTITTVAGNGSFSFSGDEGPATSAALNHPIGVALDTAGNLYIADNFNGLIRKVSAGTITTVAGGGTSLGDGGPATQGQLNSPSGVAVDNAGNIYIADSGDNRIRKVSGGIITTVAGGGSSLGDGGPATQGRLSDPEGVAVDNAGSFYIADFGYSRIRKVNGGVITTAAGNGYGGFSGDGGAAINASLAGPSGVAVDPAGDLFIADFYSERVRRVSGGIITTVAGAGGGTFFGDGGPAPGGTLLNPEDVAVDPAGDLYVADSGNNCIRKVSGGTITTVAGNGVPSFLGDGGSATSASLNEPSSVALDSAGNLYIADYLNGRIRKVSGGRINTVAGGGATLGDGGPATSALLSGPSGVAVDSAGNLYIADTYNNRVRKVSGGTITTFAGNGNAGYSGDGGSATSASLNLPERIALDSVGNLYIADSGNNRIRKVSGGIITTVAGNGYEGYSGDGGLATSASLSDPSGVAVDPAGNILIADDLNNRIRKVSGGMITTIAGNGAVAYAGDGGAAVGASFSNPSGVAVDSAGNVYIADTYSYRVREILIARPSYQVSSVTLAFSAAAGGSAPGTQTINLSSATAGLAFTTSSSATWLTVSPSNGSIPSVLQVSVDPTNLTQGSYQGTITITAPNAVPAISAVAVTVTVSAGTPATLGVSTQNVSFTATEGSAALTQQLQVTDTGGGSLAFVSNAITTSGGSWLSISAANGTATPSSPASLTLTATPGSLAPGTYSGTVAITSAGSTINVPVTLSVSAPTAVILVSQMGLSFTAVAQGGVPLPQTFGILNTGQGSMSWSAAATTLAGGSWLQISPATGTVETPYLDISLVTVTINPAGLGAGTYYGRIQVAAAAANTPQLVTVILTVLPVGFSPGPQLYPSGLIFTGVAGATPGSQDVQVGNLSGQVNNFQSGQIGTGFSFLPTNASIQPSQPTTVRVYPDFSQLSAGSITRGTITLQFSDGSPSQTINILFVVAPAGATTDQVGATDNRWYRIKLGRDAASSGCASQPLQVQYRAPQLNFSAVAGQAMLLEVQVTDGCGNLVGPGGQSATVQAHFSDNETAQAMTHIGNGVWQVGWKPVNTGLVVVTVVALLSEGGLQAAGGVSAALSGTVSAPATATPTVTAQGVVHAASDQGGVPIAPGGLITVYGTNLADGVAQDSGLPLPQLLSGTQVLLGNQPLPILYTNTGQLNVQVPYGVPVNTQYQLSVQHGNTLSVPQSLVVAQAEPGIFTVNEQGTGQGSIVRSDGVTLAQPGTPASIGETIVIYCTGLGAVTPAVKEGSPAPSTPQLSTTVNPVTVTIGGQVAQVAFSGLTPGYAGLYQINAVVPAGITTGDAVPVVLSVAGQTSPVVTIAVQ